MRKLEKLALDFCSRTDNSSADLLKLLEKVQAQAYLDCATYLQNRGLQYREEGSGVEALLAREVCDRAAEAIVELAKKARSATS